MPCHTGFEGLYVNKAGKSREGSATFFRASRYALQSHQGIALNRLFEEIVEGGPASQRHPQLLRQLQAGSSLAQDLSKARHQPVPLGLQTQLLLDPPGTAPRIFVHPSVKLGCPLQLPNPGRPQSALARGSAVISGTMLFMLHARKRALHGA